jgi:hypothetical protein
MYGQGKGRKEGLNVSSTPSHRISIYFSDILSRRFNSFTETVSVLMDNTREG